MTKLGEIWHNYKRTIAKDDEERSGFIGVDLDDVEFYENSVSYVVVNGRDDPISIYKLLNRRSGRIIGLETTVNELYWYMMEAGVMPRDKCIRFTIITKPYLIADAYSVLGRDYGLESCQTKTRGRYRLGFTQWYGTHYGRTSTLLLVAMWPETCKPLRTIVWVTRNGTPYFWKVYTRDEFLRHSIVRALKPLDRKVEHSEYGYSLVLCKRKFLPYLDIPGEVMTPCALQGVFAVPFSLESAHALLHSSLGKFGFIARATKTEYIKKCRKCKLFHNTYDSVCPTDDITEPVTSTRELKRIFDEMFPKHETEDVAIQLLISTLTSRGYVFVGFDNLEPVAPERQQQTGG